MKTQRRIFERAKQGDPAAIATWLACCLHRRGLSATTTPEGNCLHVLLESAQAPDQQTAIDTVLHELGQLAPAFQAVQVTGKQTGEAQPVWDCRLDLPTTLAPATARSLHPHRFMYTGMAAIAALIAVNLVLGFRSMFQLWDESRDFVNTAIPTIVDDWDVDALVDRASPALLEATPPADLQQSFEQFSQTLGSFERAEPANCNVSPSFTLEGKITTSHCEVTIDFAKATAIAEFDLVRRESQWQIDRFSLQPREDEP